ncbi:MAG: shikimate kinase [Microcoleaceae cyanobacterium]
MEMIDQARPLQERLQGLNIYLIGMMGAGKTTVGQLLATALNYRFIDTDAVITQAAGQSISELFARAGESEFRDLESKVLAEVTAYPRLTVATGGGIVLRQTNWSYLQQGLVIWLNVPVEQLYQHLQGDTTRPLLQDPDPLKKLETLLAERRSLYSAADLSISIPPEATPDQIVQMILEQIPQALKSEAKTNFVSGFKPKDFQELS